MLLGCGEVEGRCGCPRIPQCLSRIQQDRFGRSGWLSLQDLGRQLLLCNSNDKSEIVGVISSALTVSLDTSSLCSVYSRWSYLSLAYIVPFGAEVED